MSKCKYASLCPLLITVLPVLNLSFKKNRVTDNLFWGLNISSVIKLNMLEKHRSKVD